MFIGLVLFSQNVSTETVINGYTVQRAKLREAYVDSIKKLNQATIAKLEKATDDKSKALVKELVNWDSCDEIAVKIDKVEGIGIPGVDAKDQPKVAANKDAYPDGTILFNGHHYLLFLLSSTSYTA